MAPTPWGRWRVDSVYHTVRRRGFHSSPLGQGQCLPSRRCPMMFIFNKQAYQLTNEHSDAQDLISPSP